VEHVAVITDSRDRADLIAAPQVAQLHDGGKCRSRNHVKTILVTPKGPLVTVTLVAVAVTFVAVTLVALMLFPILLAVTRRPARGLVAVWEIRVQMRRCTPRTIAVECTQPRPIVAQICDDTAAVWVHDTAVTVDDAAVGRISDYRIGIESDDLKISDTTISPGKFVLVKFTPTKAGTYVVHCSVVCGPGHPDMALIIVVTDK
jgi:hypothetical protein